MIQKRVAVAGSWVTVDVHGDPDGPALVVVPGALSDAAAWAPVARHLRGWPTVAVVNRRGRSPSGPLGAGYGLGTEVRDAAAVLRTVGDVRALLGWSYGGLVALHLANAVAVPHVIAYEPVVAPFGAAALPQLRRAQEAGDLDATVTAALGRIAGAPPQAIAALRADAATWDELRRLAVPLHAETLAIDEAPRPAELAVRAGRVDLVVGARSRGRAPYGTTFDDVARLVPAAGVHELDGQGHLAHLEAPEQLAALVDRLRLRAA
ncbi:alpha/beta fold hydrolase [Kineococcus vitellinus]|uniref:alpha/beta fold hydrolase n=1 Tax=Kineococcus vitellinus TaxID=2696565 RepID=UPI001F10382D|nr:alpha/beta hydrolase [Kineococcus vitellinus]